MNESFASLATLETSVSSTVPDPLNMLAPSEADGEVTPAAGRATTITRDTYGNRKYEDVVEDGPEWEWPSDDEEYAEQVADLADRCARVMLQLDCALQCRELAPCAHARSFAERETTLYRFC
eukprot:SAG31_NODE_7205_length_1755_cov_2.266304_1_plen_122_part_00